jgi:fructose-bisphosphate aldolase class I
MNPSELARVAGAMVAKGKGVLAADESTGTIKKRLDSIKLESAPENHRAYRELLFGAPGAAESIARLTALAATGRYASAMESRAA